MICAHQGCQSDAFCKYYWPSADKKPTFHCLMHALWAVKIADVLGFHLPLLRITEEDEAAVKAEVVATIEENFGDSSLCPKCGDSMVTAVRASGARLVCFNCEP